MYKFQSLLIKELGIFTDSTWKTFCTIIVGNCGYVAGFRGKVDEN